MKVLSGGNPQIAQADGDAPVQAYIAAMPGWKRDLGERLDALIVRNVPNVRKAVKWSSLFYGIEGQDWFLSFRALTHSVKVTFFRGTWLQPVPPGGTMRSTDARWIDIREGDQLDKAQMADWVKQAAALLGWVPLKLTELIAEEGAKLRELHAQVHRTFLHRDHDAQSRLEWERACAAFHSRKSRLDPYIERACKKARYTDKNLLEFVVCFLEVDPWFFGSGYLKQIFLTRLKRSDLDEATKGRLRRVLLDAVNRRGTRDFKHYCRLAAVIGDEGLVAALEKASDNNDRAVASRAKLMLGTIRQRQIGVSA